MRRRAGFTFVELLIVVTIIGILASVAVPKFRTVKRQAMAAQLVGDYNAIRVAAMTFFTDSGYFPAEASAGAVPRNLRPYLPQNFNFRKQEWTMDYENLRILRLNIVGIAFTTPDQALGRTAMKLLQQSPIFTFGGRSTVVISGL